MSVCVCSVCCVCVCVWLYRGIVCGCVGMSEGICAMMSERRRETFLQESGKWEHITKEERERRGKKREKERVGMGSPGEAGRGYMMRKRVRVEEEVCGTVRVTDEARETYTEQAGRSCLSVTVRSHILSVCLPVCLSCLSVTPGLTVRSPCLLSSSWSVCLSVCVSVSFWPPVLF